MNERQRAIGYVVIMIASFLGIMLMLWFLLTIIGWGMDEVDRCEAANGKMSRDYQCVQVIENY